MGCTFWSLKCGTQKAVGIHRPRESAQAVAGRTVLTDHKSIVVEDLGRGTFGAFLDERLCVNSDELALWSAEDRELSQQSVLFSAIWPAAYHRPPPLVIRRHPGAPSGDDAALRKHVMYYVRRALVEAQRPGFAWYGLCIEARVDQSPSLPSRLHDVLGKGTPGIAVSPDQQPPGAFVSARFGACVKHEPQGSSDVLVIPTIPCADECDVQTQATGRVGGKGVELIETSYAG
jgi:hypothetical protein